MLPFHTHVFGYFLPVAGAEHAGMLLLECKPDTKSPEALVLSFGGVLALLNPPLASQDRGLPHSWRSSEAT